MAQSTQNKNPTSNNGSFPDSNKELKEKYPDISEENIKYICSKAATSKEIISFPKYSEKITPFLERVLELEGLLWEEDVDSLVALQGMEGVYRLIRESWDNKWSKCFCTGITSVRNSYLDYILFIAEKKQTLYDLYAKNWLIRANINRVVLADPTIANSKEPITFLDMMNYAIEIEDGTFSMYPDQLKSVKRFRDGMIDNGAKTAAELGVNSENYESYKKAMEGN